MAEEGFRGMFRGMMPSIIGVAPSRAIYFWTYSSVKRKLCEYRKDDSITNMISAICAGP